jgi:AraC-like DNA-binding protein
MPETVKYMFKRIDSRPDPLAEIWRAVRVGSVMSARIEARAPWALRFGFADRRAGFHVLTAGSADLVLDNGIVHAMAAGDIVLLPHGTAHVVADRAGTPSSDVPSDLGPGAHFTVPGGEGALATLLCGSYSFAAEGDNPLLRGLPDVLHLSAATKGADLERTVALLTNESRINRPGSSLVVERLVDLLFVYALRAWLDAQDHRGSTSLIGALGDIRINPAIRAIHEQPAKPWALDELAALCGLSRAVFVRRFRRAVGEAPGSYLTRWRMALASDRLARGDRVAAVAADAGYSSEFAFAKAFKRFSGTSPGQHRRRYSGHQAA